MITHRSKGRYIVEFIYLKGVETPCIANRLVVAESKKHALRIINDSFYVLKFLDVNRQY